MGFSVSASAAIIFISFLMAAATVYNAWDNVYAQIKDAESFENNLQLSWVHSRVEIVSITSDGTDVTVDYINNGTTLSARYLNIFRDGVYSSTLDWDYFLPGEINGIIHSSVSDGSHVFEYVFDNGCVLRFNFTKSGTSVTLNNQQWYCPTEVS
ncbi:hypothetical protein [Palaeococcus ferrophilus]|uniref:hypothetical protein n=1 Tax=Palaeococcus ferrophilus TaxID=83868 RepID=UPI000697693C|nr:hypothetical protein [Palaeococcus ferrophilus]